MWEALRRWEFEEAANAGGIVIIPVASIERHGYHLPVNTDTNWCLAIAHWAAQAKDEFPVLVLPPIWTGYPPHHMPYSGTITLRYHRFVEVLTQVASIETSLELYLQPELVERQMTAWVPGVWGDPSTGVREKGERIINVAANSLMRVLRDYYSGALEDKLIWRKEVL